MSEPPTQRNNRAVSVICLHGYQSHPDILANAIHKIESAAEKTFSPTASSSSAAAAAVGINSFTYPCAKIPVQRTKNAQGMPLPDLQDVNTPNSKVSSSPPATPSGSGGVSPSTFDSIQLFGWLPEHCTCCGRRSDENEDTSSSSRKCSSASSSGCCSANDSHFRAAFEIVLSHVLPKNEEEGVEEDVSTAKLICSRYQHFVLFGFSQGGIILSALLMAIFVDPENSASDRKMAQLDPFVACLSKIFDPERKRKLQKIFRTLCVGVCFGGTPYDFSPALATALAAAAAHSSAQHDDEDDDDEKRNHPKMFEFSSIPSLFIIGERDLLVSKESALKLAKLFHQPTLLVHDGGHPIPSSAKCVEAFLDFFQRSVAITEASLDEAFGSDDDDDDDDADNNAQIDDDQLAKLPRRERKRLRALRSLSNTLQEELECVSLALPEGTTVQVVSPSSSSASATTKSPLLMIEKKQQQQNFVEVRVQLTLPGLEDDDIRRAVLSFKKNGGATKTQQQQQQTSSLASTNVLLTIHVPIGYPDTTTDIPRCTLSSLPPLLAAQSHRCASVLAAVYDVSASLAGTPMVMQICMCVQNELENWVTSAAQQLLEGNYDSDGAAAGGGEHSSLLDAEEAAAAADPWRQVELETPEERNEIVSQVHKQIDDEIVASSSRSSRGVVGGNNNKQMITVQNGGEWRFVVGLIGKPSCGKSSTFNSVTDPESEAQAAKVASFPFTTIEPNVGRAFVGVPCPCRLLFGAEGEAEKVCAACYGHIADATSHHQQQNNENGGGGNNNNNNNIRFRRHPIEVRDVAGLVPGAYQGRGKGNKFLNDLTDADVLIHVIDGSGRSTVDGVELQEEEEEEEQKIITKDFQKTNNATSTTTTTATTSSGSNLTDGASSPEYDCIWIRNEIHNWIFDNLEAKWSTIRVKPRKLLTMFSGYQATLRLVEVALESCGVPVSEIEIRVPAWTPRDLHRLVAHFIRLRFPIVLAVNKCDTPGAMKRAEHVQKSFPGYCVKTMSARVECELLKLRRAGIISNYTSGSNSFDVDAEKQKTLSAQQQQQIAALRKFLQKFGSTGVQDVLARAIALRPPLLCFPYEGDLDTLVQRANTTVLSSAAAKNEKTTNSSSSSSQQQQQPQQSYLTDCLALRPGTTAEVAFRTASRLGMLEGTGGGGGSGGASSPAGATASRYHEYSLVRCDVVALPLQSLWKSSTSSGDDGGDKEDGDGGRRATATTTPGTNNAQQQQQVAMRRTVCRKDDSLPSACCVKMVGKKG